MIGVFIVSWLAHYLSQYVERSQQRTRELAGLEELGRAILAAPLDGSTLPDILQEHTAPMFLRSQIEIRLFPDRTMLHFPESWPVLSTMVWEWQQANPKIHVFSSGEALPWGEKLDMDTAVILAPIRATENGDLIGGIYISRYWDSDAIKQLVPAVQSLAAQIASALHRAEVYRIEQEMAVAGNIQASFLPDSLPALPGWQLAATLEPAREASGDFYDFIPLSNGKLGILIADVADKGMGAALYMAATRTLIRIYAVEHDAQPESAVQAVNNHLLANTQSNLFVTVFYGILDPTDGTFTYCNAGHNPPVFMSAQNGNQPQLLNKTGMIVGVMEDLQWEPRTIHMTAADLLLLYTDGVTDAENKDQDFFGDARLLETVSAHTPCSAQDVQDALLAEIHTFVGDVPQFDDITLVVLKRSA